MEVHCASNSHVANPVDLVELDLMPIEVVLYSVYVEGVGITLYDLKFAAMQYKKNSQAPGVTVWGVGKHVIEVENCVEYRNPEDDKENG